VVSRLTELGMEAYVPLKKEKKQWSDRKKIVITPLINGYVFVRCEERKRDEVFKANGVIQYVRYNGTDAIIKDKEIEVLKSIEDKGYHAEASPLQKLEAGQKAIITQGRFKGMTGLVERLAGHDIYTLSLESIGYSLKINLPHEILEKHK
jgi:transcription antitermination factor NusG